MTVEWMTGDVMEQVRTLPDSSVDLVACSPPFLALRNYNNLPGQWGSEPTPAAFLDNLLTLTGELRRVLTPHGSIAIELGDTYSGSGGAGGDYNDGGMREGQSGFGGSEERRRRRADHWPLPKSLTGVPTLYAWSLAYGRNLLNPAHTFEPWRIRNMIVWARNNPPVGALGDKYRPATSYITVACPSARRWFDLDAVRTQLRVPEAKGVPRAGTQLDHHQGNRSTMGDYDATMSAGAPPLDYWTDEPEDLTWQVNSTGSSASVSIESREPCGPHDGGERTTSSDCPVHGDRPAPVPTAQHDEREESSRSRTQHNDGHHAQSPEPADSCDESTSTHPDQQAATPHSTALNRTALAPSTNQPGTPSVQTADGTAHTPTSPESSGPDPDMSVSSSDEACPPAGAHEMQPHSAHTSDQESACTCSFYLVKTTIHRHYAMWPAKLAERLILSMCPAHVCNECGEPRRRITGPAEYAGRSRSAPTLGWSDCGHDDWRPGRVLDPFAGTGTTLAVADIHGRDATGIDLDPANAGLYERRYVEVWKSIGKHGVSPITPHGQQLDLLTQGDV